MYKDSKRTCTAIVLLIKPFVWRRSRRRRRRGLLKLPNVDFGRIFGGRERDSENTAHVGRITKIVDCIRIVFGLRYNYKPNLSLKMI